MTLKSDDRDELYSNEYGSCAYFAGAIRVLTDNLDMALYEAGVKYEALASDVFCIDKLDEIIIKKHLKERIVNLIEEDIEDKLDAELDKMKINNTHMSMQETIFGYYKDRLDCDKDKIKSAIEKYFKDVEYYLGKPKKVYEAHKETLDMCGLVSNSYLGILFNLVFVEYDKHMLMFVHGSCE